MTGPLSALKALNTKLCPWLRPVLRQLDAARETGRLGHAWLLAGPSGIGKINLALVFASRLLQGTTEAVEPPALEADEAVAAMRERHAPTDHHPDLHWLFPEEEKRTISVEQIRSVCEALALKAHRGPAKVVVIEPAEGMTAAAANALLKTLEEPFGDTYLLLVSDQPERLPATIRSRCQRLSVARPRAKDVMAWLRTVDAGDMPALWVAAGGSPLRIAEFLSEDNSSINMLLEDKLILISHDRIDPQFVAEEWFQLDSEWVLGWLTRQIHLSIRARVAPNASTAVTDLSSNALHNAWSALTLRKLFDQHQAAERLLNQLGAGTNVELALRALLLGFQPNRG